MAIESQSTVPRHRHTISRSDISEQALEVLSTLEEAGFAAFLVGGGVRDLLLGRKPKDFDVATDARPEQVRKLFRNSRLIGRRFRLVHVLFGRHDVIEVATFRAAAQGESKHHQQTASGLIICDNVYGTLEEDAWRRDFTINALYYSISDCTVVDYVGGLQDLKSGIVRLIGDPSQRYKEDPVRMIRAVRIATKLDFVLDSKTQQTLLTYPHLLEQVSTDRLFEEVVKSFHCGVAENIYHRLKEYRLLGYLFPQTLACLEQPSHYPVVNFLIETLRNTDERVREQKPVNPAFLFAAFLWYPLLLDSQKRQDKGVAALPALEQAMGEVLQQQNQKTRIPKRFIQVIREIWLLQLRLPRRYGKRAFGVLQHPRFRAGYDFLMLREKAEELESGLGEWWTVFQEADEKMQRKMVRKLRKQPKKNTSGSA